MADLARIKRNVAKMVAQGAPAVDVDGYIASEGVSLDDVRNFTGDRTKAQHYEFGQEPGRDPSTLPKGYDPKTGTVDRFKSDDPTIAATTSFTEGVPIAGPLMRKGIDNAAAAIGSTISGEDYDKVLGEVSRISKSAQEANPKLSKGSEIAGAVAGTVPMMLMAPELMGAGNAPLMMRSLLSMTSSAGIGGADSAVRSGGDPKATLWGAGLGAATGFLGPGAGQLIGAGIRGGRNLLSNLFSSETGERLSGEALKFLTDAAEADRLTPALLRSEMDRLGPGPTMVMDLGPNLQRQAGAVASMPGRGQEAVRDAILRREAGANTRIRSEVDDALGPAPVPSQIDEAIRANQQTLGPEYGRVFTRPYNVDTSYLARRLDGYANDLRGPAQQAARQVRAMLNRTGTQELDRDARTLFNVRQAIDDLTTTNTHPRAGQILTEARQMVDDTLARATPGLKNVDAQFQELARQREALARGQQFLDSGKTAPRPAEVERDVFGAPNEHGVTTGGPVPEGQLIGPSAVPLRLRQGTRAEIERILGTRINDRIGLRDIVKGEGDWNRDRLVSLYGQERADRVLKLLDREKRYAEGYHKALLNSETQPRRAHQEALVPTETGRMNVADVAAMGAATGGTLPGIALAAGIKGTDAMVKALRNARNASTIEELGRALTGGEDVIRQMERYGGQKLTPQQLAVVRAMLAGPGMTQSQNVQMPRLRIPSL